MFSSGFVDMKMESLRGGGYKIHFNIFSFFNSALQMISLYSSPRL